MGTDGCCLLHFFLFLHITFFSFFISFVVVLNRDHFDLTFFFKFLIKFPLFSFLVFNSSQKTPNIKKFCSVFISFRCFAHEVSTRQKKLNV